jgi:FkbM family methyltransferase
MYSEEKMHKKTLLIIALYPLAILAQSNIIHKMLYKNSLIPQGTELRQRVLTTICCDDCEDLPKVEDAGKIFETNDKNPYQLTHNGLKILKDCYYGSWMTTLIRLLHGHHEPQEEKIFHMVLKHMPSNAVMIELGSYWGYYSMWFQKEIEGARNFLIEPDPKNIIIGKNNFELNNMQGHFTQAMVGAKSADNASFTDWDYNKHLIPAITIDDFALHNNLDYIHILHSDIQGAEVEMLKGCSRLIAEKRIAYFFVSTHRGVHELCFNILHDAGLDIILSITREESFSADGLIVAKLPGIPGPGECNVSRRSEKFCTLINEIADE